jgi:hypothetical protein
VGEVHRDAELGIVCILKAETARHGSINLREGEPEENYSSEGEHEGNERLLFVSVPSLEKEKQAEDNQDGGLAHRGEALEVVRNSVEHRHCLRNSGTGGAIGIARRFKPR